MRGNERIYKYDKETAKLLPPNFDLCKYRSDHWLELGLWTSNIFRRKICRINILLGDIEDARAQNIKNINQAVYPSEIDAGITNSKNLVEIAEKYGFATWLEHPTKYNGGREPLASVSLSAPDDAFIKEFLRWVNAERLKAGVSPQIKSVSISTMGKWREARIIEYMDLVQWFEINEIEVTRGQIGKILFPDDNRGGEAERVRKTTEKWVKQINDRFEMERIRNSKW
jgi:hypothetical protein